MRTNLDASATNSFFMSRIPITKSRQPAETTIQAISTTLLKLIYNEGGSHEEGRGVLCEGCAYRSRMNSPRGYLYTQHAGRYTGLSLRSGGQTPAYAAPLSGIGSYPTPFFLLLFFSFSRLIHIIDWQQHGIRLGGWPQGKWEGRMHGRLETTDTPLVFTRLPPSPCCFCFFVFFLVSFFTSCYQIFFPWTGNGRPFAFFEGRWLLIRANGLATSGSVFHFIIFLVSAGSGNVKRRKTP